MQFYIPVYRIEELIPEASSAHTTTLAAEFRSIRFLWKLVWQNERFALLLHLEMENGKKETMRIRTISCCFVVLALAVFKPFGLDVLQWQAYAHLLVILVVGICVCMLTENIMKYIVRKPRSYDYGVGYIIRRNLWFQLINTPLIALSICLYRHFVLNNHTEGNQLSWSNFFETLIIIAFCSFAIGLYWRFKFRSRYLAAELEEMRLMNEQLQKLQSDAQQRDKADEVAKASETAEKSSMESPSLSSNIVLTGTTNETVTLKVSNLLYIEAVGNYVKVCHLFDGQVQTDMLRATSKQMEDDLKTYPMVVRCHRAFLVNLGQVEKIVSKTGSMQLIIKHCRESIPVSRSNMAQIKEAIKGV